MSIPIRWLCVAAITLGAFACGKDPADPCSPADAAAGRCKPASAKRAPLPPGFIIPDWAVHLCRDWRRSDGSCEQAEIMADYEECLTQQGAPESQRLRDQNMGNRAVQRAGERATYTCLEMRRWNMREAARDTWMGKPPPPPPPSPPS